VFLKWPTSGLQNDYVKLNVQPNLIPGRNWTKSTWKFYQQN